MNVTPSKESKLPIHDFLREVPPYTLESPAEDDDVLFLNRNENYFVSNEVQQQLLDSALRKKDLRLYERPFNMRFLERLAEFHHTTSEHIFAGNGSDEIIYLLPRITLSPSYNGVLPHPSFSPYTSAMKSVGAEVRYVILSPSFDLPIQEFHMKTDVKSRLTFLAIPNNPTGNAFDKRVVLEILQNFPGIVVIDEAYGPLAGISYEKHLPKYENMVILRSFSKAFGAAGIRVGYCLANPQVIDALRLISQPYNLNTLTQSIACAILDRYGDYELINKNIQKEREIWFSKLQRIPEIIPYPSETNFILFKTTIDSNYVFKELLKHRIVLRKHVIPQGDHFLRVTIAPQPIRQRFLDTLKKILEQYGEK